MAKPITAEQLAEFNKHCRKIVQHGDQYMTIEGLPESLRSEEWEFHASNYDPETSHDYLELLEKSEFTLEEDGHSSFFVSPK